MANFDSEADARRTDGPIETWAVALDGGTTNTRARLLRGHQVVATAQRAVGVRDTVLDDSSSRPAGAPTSAGRANREALMRAVREVVEEVCGVWEKEAMAGRGAGDMPGLAFLVAAGMLSSEVGLFAVPHVIAPAGLDDLARASVLVSLPEVDERPILVVPGIRTPAADGPDGWLQSDVMRGEECETLAAHAALVADGRVAPDSARSSSGPARTPSSSRSTPTAESCGASRPWPARSCKRWRNTRCWRPACPGSYPINSTGMPRSRARSPRSDTDWAERRSWCGSPR